jgi:hypothetical protein
MSEYEKLRDEDLVRHGNNMKPTVHIKSDGLFTFNRRAVEHLGLSTGVSFCVEKSSRNCFAVMRDDSGYKLRKTNCGRLLIDNSALAKHIINLTLERCPLPAGVEKPKSVVFVIALLPVDDGDNKDVYALIQKK